MPQEIVAPPGLEGVIAGETAICCVEQGKLLYRGYPISELAEKSCFEEVAHLLIFGELPTRAELDAFRAKLSGYFSLPTEVIDTIRRIPKDAPMMDVLRTGVSMAGHFDPTVRAPAAGIGAAPASGEALAAEEKAALQERATWLLATAAQVLGARFRLINGKEPVAPKKGLSHAAQILHLCHGAEPDELSAKLLDLTLVLYAEHDFNASTFTMRVIASTMSDMVSSMVGAIGSLKGPLHGGANEAAMELIARFKSADGLRPPRVQERRPPRPYPRTRDAQAGRHEGPPGPRGGLRRDQDADRLEGQADLPQRRLPVRADVLPPRPAAGPVHAAVRLQPHHRLDGALHRTGRREPAVSAAEQVHGAKGAVDGGGEVSR